MKPLGKLFNGTITHGLITLLLLTTTHVGLSQQVLASGEGASPLKMTMDDLPEMRRLTGQDLTNFVNVLDATPTLTPDELPRNGMLGNFFSLQHSDWPPLPGDTVNAPVWQMEDFYLLNDLNYNYDPAPVKRTKARAKDVSLDPTVPGDGTGDTNTYSPDGSNYAVSYSTNDLWLQFVAQSNSVSSLIINTPWNVTGSNFMFDVFATTNLAWNVPGLNGTNWMLVTRSAPGQTNLFVAPMPGAVMCFYRLGTMQDKDGDGLTDAYEKLVSHSDPNVWDSNGNGIGDGDEISPGGLPWRLMAVRPSSAVIFADIPNATQGGGCGEATVYLPSPAPVGGTTVQYYLGGTASLNSDYTVSPTANQLFIPAGNIAGSIAVCALGTNRYSDIDLYADITLTNATGYLVDGTPAHVNIIDTGSPGVRVFALPPWSRRPSSTYGTNVVGFYFIRDGDSTNALTVGLSLSGSTAMSNSEYASFPTSITFPANVRTNWLPVTLIANSTNPTNTILALTITNAPGYQIDPTNGTASLAIAATAAPVMPVVQVTASIPIATTTTPGQFTFTRSFATTNALRVYLHGWGDNATTVTSTNGAETNAYVALPSYVDIPANTTSATLSLTANQQTNTVQPVNVTLAAGDYTIGTNNTATVTIDATGATTVSVAVTRNGAHLGSGGVYKSAELTFTRTGSTATPLTLAATLQPSGGDFIVTGASLVGPGGGALTWQVGQSVIKGSLSVSYYWNTALGAENDDNYVAAGILFSNAYYNNIQTVYFMPAWESVQISSLFSPATVLTNGTSQPNALSISRRYTHIGSGQQRGLTVVISTSGSASNGVDYTMNTIVNFNTNQTSVSVPVTALNNTNQGWRTLVARLDPAANNQAVPDASADTAYVRIANPNNVVDDTDMDNDGIPDGFELNNLAGGLDPITPNNPYADADRDGLGIMDELSLGLNPNVPDSPPTYPSIEGSDYVSLTMRIGAQGKMLTEPVSSCAVCHAVTVRAGNVIHSTDKTDRTHNPRLSDYLIRLTRGSNYPVQVTCNPFASSLLSSNQAAATTSPQYTAKYVAMFLADTNGTPYPFIVDTNALLGTNLPMVKEVLPKRATLYVPDLTIATDNDRDGVVNFTNRNDRTSATNPFVFWINDDSDSGNDDSAQDLDPGSNPINSASSSITCIRDLEDFARLQFKVDGLPGNLLTNAGYQLKLYVTNLVGTPSFRLLPAADSNGGLGYLTNLTTANNQISQLTLGVASSAIPLSLGNSLWQSAGPNSFFLPMIFEGITTGSCVVTFGFSSNNAPPVAVSRPFYLNLQEVTSLYEHWTVGDNTNTEWMNIPPHAYRTTDSAVFNRPQNNSDLDNIVFVHGWRMQPWERRAFASTAYKRLWHLGYKGRLSFYSWPTDYTDTSFWDMRLLANRQNYDRSEQRAWYSSFALRSLIQSLNKTASGRVRLIAHSMGNIVASEALRLAGQKVSSLPAVVAYIASQAASVAHAYDATNPQSFTLVQFADELYANYPRNGNKQPYFTGMKNAVSKTGQGVVRTFNFHNRVDYALSTWYVWPLNQSLKPDLGWGYNPFDNTFYRLGFPYSLSLSLTPFPYEIYAHDAIAGSAALGATEYDIYSVRGEIGNAFDLQTNFNFQANDYEHSAQFNSINPNRRAYWQQVLATFSLTNSP